MQRDPQRQVEVVFTALASETWRQGLQE